MITVEQVKVRVRKIAAMADDDEAAHSAEDQLRTDVLKAIEQGSSDAVELAHQALVTEGFDFARWCA